MATKFKSLIWFIILAAVILFFSLYVVWLGDDLDYGFYISDTIWNSSGPIDSIKSFFHSQGNHYHNVNGRFVAHALVQLYCAILGKTAFAITNALIYCIFIYIILRICGVRHILNHTRSIITCGAVVLLTFVTKMMPTTQIGFVWMFTLNLLWLKLFFSNKRRSILQVVLICLLGILAGNGQEALTMGLSGALGLWWLHRRCRIGWRRTAMLVCYWAGAIAICCSPGTLNRASGIHIAYSDSLIYLLFSLRATYMLIITLAILKHKKLITLTQVYRKNALFVNTMALLLVFNLFISVYCNRQLFGIELMAILIMLRTLPDHAFHRLINGAAVKIVAAILIVQGFSAYKVKRQYDTIEALYVNSDDGIVYFDRTLANNNLFMREYRYYEEIIGQFNSDTHHSLQKFLHEKHKGKRYIHIWPTCLKGATHVCDTVVQYAPQHFYAITLDSYNSLPTMYSRGKATVLSNIRATVVGNGWTSMLIIPHVPFAPIDSVTVN